jgi:16S rRNA (cytidine1402-2'-O)-methyltransferase
MSMKRHQVGILYIVATPIGNLQDITLRAIDVLQKVDVIAAEDTRHSLPLLRQFAIAAPTISLHEYNERERTDELLKRLQEGQSIALISDAGTPLISDPGYFLVHEARALGIRVVPIPGACAAISALSAAGLPTDRFIFEGFLPVKSSARKKRLQALLHEPRTIIFYEAPRRILECLEDLDSLFEHDRQIVIARELTKVFEVIRAGTIIELITWIKTNDNQQRGEMVVLVEGAKKNKDANEQSIESIESILSILLAELPLKQAVELTAKITGNKKNNIYKRALQIKNV